jgi:hypothetical protein
MAMTGEAPEFATGGQEGRQRLELVPQDVMSRTVELDLVPQAAPDALPLTDEERFPSAYQYYGS